MAKAKRKTWIKVVVIIAALAIIGGLVFANMAKKKDNSKEVTAVKVERDQIVQTVPGTGRIQPEIQVDISANVSGEIVALPVKEGDRVKKGDLLVSLDREKYGAAMEQSQSALKSSQASLEKSRSELRRVQELFDQGLSSEADLEAAQADFQFRSAEVERSQAFLKEARDDLSKTSIYAPMDGVVSQLNKEPGEMALGAQFQQDIIMTIADLTKMEVEVEVDESDIVSVSLLDTAEVKIDAYPDTTFKGVVREIAHTATTRGMGTSEEITNFRVNIRLSNVPTSLRPGMSATSDIITNVHENALSIPIQCVVMKAPLPPEDEGADKDSLAEESEDHGEQKPDKKPKKQEHIEVVFKIVDGVVQQVPVTTGISSDTNIEILTGLEEGDEVVSGPFRLLTQMLKDGDAVSIKEHPDDQRAEDRSSSPEAEPELMDEM
ncbi:efflux RND transporter periplasmic adaptor subunit [bacterium]|nr:efflux RND transporter periplasmic adaptor subunit [bacterium]